MLNSLVYLGDNLSRGQSLAVGQKNLPNGLMMSVDKEKGSEKDGMTTFIWVQD